MNWMREAFQDLKWDQAFEHLHVSKEGFPFSAQCRAVFCGLAEIVSRGESAYFKRHLFPRTSLRCSSVLRIRRPDEELQTCERLVKTITPETSGGLQD